MNEIYQYVGANLYLQPTPAGAYQAVAAPEPTADRRLLLALMRAPLSTKARLSELAWSAQLGEDDAVATLFRAQERGWVEGFHSPQGPPTGALENIAADAVRSLSSTGHGLLADAQGFCVAGSGFDAEASEFLAAVSADIASLHERHAAYLADASGTSASVWAMVDMAGNSTVGFWPLFVGPHRFVLALGGLPALNRPALVHLVWALNVRYGAGSPATRTETS